MAGCSSGRCRPKASRSEEHTSELQSLMRKSYAGFCLKKKTNKINKTKHIYKYRIQNIENTSKTQYQKIAKNSKKHTKNNHTEFILELTLNQNDVQAYNRTFYTNDKYIRNYEHN